MGDDIAEKNYSPDPEDQIVNNTLYVSGNRLPDVLPDVLPVAFPVALPVAGAVNKLVGRVSLKLCLLCAGSFLAGYMVIPLIVSVMVRNSSLLTGLMSLFCPFISIAILFAGGRLIYGSWRNLTNAFELGKFPVMEFAVWGFPLAVALIIASGIVTTFWQIFGEWMGWSFGVPPTVEVMQGDHWQVAAMAVTALFAAPLYEEILFRRFLFGGVYQYCGALTAYMVTALAFGLMHMSLLQLPGFLIIASLWQFLYVRNRNLWVSIILHFYNNLIAVSVLLIYRYRDFLTGLLMDLKENI